MNNILPISEPTVLILSKKDEYISEVSHLLRNMDIKVQSVSDASTVVDLIEKGRALGIILDLTFNNADGIEVCRQLKSSKETEDAFVIFYTEEDEEYIQIAALNSGADDYITSPTRPRIMEHRVKALIRRREEKYLQKTGGIISTGDLNIDRERYVVNVGGRSFTLPRKEFELLALLAGKPGKVFSRKELSRKVWGEEQELKGRTIDVHIRKLREKVGEQFIQTIKGIGYKWKEWT